MIDIHSHVLYGIDDGCIDYQVSLELIKQAEAEGINKIILTPHYLKGSMYNLESDELKVRFDHFKKHLRSDGVNIEVYCGNELFIHYQLDELLTDHKVMTLADSNYILVEFAFFDYPNENDEILYNLTLAGYKIIIAHPERYKYVKKDPNFCLRWLDKGYLLQVNQQSILSSVNNLAMRMIKNGFVSFVASDAHNYQRPLSLKRALSLVENVIGEKEAEKLFITNPQKVIDDELIINDSYTPIKKGIFERLL